MFNNKTNEFKSIYQDVRKALQSTNDKDNNLEKHHIVSMVNTILRRKRFKMSFCEVLTSNILKFCCKKNNKCIKDTTYQRHRLLQNAEQMLNRKLDVLELLKSEQMNKILISAILSPE